MSHILVLLFFLVQQRYETQPYEVIGKIDTIEIRFYPSAMKVSVDRSLASANSFNALFRYISGENEANQKIAMTTPVYRYTHPDAVETMAFVLPKKYQDSAPKPLRKGVEVYRSEPGFFAAITYGGYSNSAKEEKYKSALINKLSQSNIQTMGEAFILSYDAPFKFYNRKNEILIAIEKQN